MTLTQEALGLTWPLILLIVIVSAACHLARRPFRGATS